MISFIFLHQLIELCEKNHHQVMMFIKKCEIHLSIHPLYQRKKLKVNFVTGNFIFLPVAKC